MKQNVPLRKGLSALQNAAEAEESKGRAKPFTVMMRVSVETFVEEISVRQKQQISRVRSQPRKGKLPHFATYNAHPRFSTNSCV